MTAFTGSCYSLANAHPSAPARFAALEHLFDRYSTENLTATGVGPGWDCLDVGAGAGSIARWLCDRVSPCGSVLATDIDTRFLDEIALPNLEVRQHDVAAEPLRAAAFDLIHARLLFVIVPGRKAALENMIRALKPGGWLVAEEFDSLSMPSDSEMCGAETELRSVAAVRTVMSQSGADLLFGRRLAGRLADFEMIEVNASAHFSIWRGGSIGASLLTANIAQLRDRMLERGLVKADQIEQDLDRLRDPETMFLSPILWCVRGRRPE